MPALPSGFASRTASVKDLRMHYVIGGSGDPLVILHGGWDSWWAWHEVIPALAQQHTVILPALRGLAKTSKAPDGYDANNLGDDIYRLVSEQLGFERFALVGHDWGAVAAYALAAQYGDAVTRLAIFEMVMPGLGFFEQAWIPQPGGNFLWHMGWLSVPDIPEMLLAGHLREFMQMFFTHYAGVPDAVSKESLDHYVELYSEAGALRAFMLYYHQFWAHAAQIQEHMATKLSMPVMAYGGDACLGEMPLQCMQQLATDVRGGVIPNCGHWIGEEAPAFVLESLQEFLHSGSRDGDSAVVA